jgi:hypothetical protein
MRPEDWTWTGMEPSPYQEGLGGEAPKSKFAPSPNPLGKVVGGKGYIGGIL